MGATAELAALEAAVSKAAAARRVIGWRWSGANQLVGTAFVRGWCGNQVASSAHARSAVDGRFTALQGFGLGPFRTGSLAQFFGRSP